MACGIQKSHIPTISSIIPKVKGQPHPGITLLLDMEKMILANPAPHIITTNVFARTDKDDIGLHRHQMPMIMDNTPVSIAIHQYLVIPLLDIKSLIYSNFIFADKTD